VVFGPVSATVCTHTHPLFWSLRLLWSFGPACAAPCTRAFSSLSIRQRLLRSVPVAVHTRTFSRWPLGGAASGPQRCVNVCFFRLAASRGRPLVPVSDARNTCAFSGRSLQSLGLPFAAICARTHFPARRFGWNLSAQHSHTRAPFPAGHRDTEGLFGPASTPIALMCLPRPIASAVHLGPVWRL
jgi:hypothetical protein